MRRLILIGVVVVAGITSAGALLDASAGESGERVPTSGPPAVSDIAPIEMAESHRPMMEQMRATVVPQMPSIMTSDPMWQNLTPDMVRAMETQQADIDRMLARG